MKRKSVTETPEELDELTDKSEREQIKHEILIITLGKFLDILKKYGIQKAQEQIFSKAVVKEIIQEAKLRVQTLFSSKRTVEAECVVEFVKRVCCKCEMPQPDVVASETKQKFTEIFKSLMREVLTEDFAKKLKQILYKIDFTVDVIAGGDVVQKIKIHPQFTLNVRQFNDAVAKIPGLIGEELNRLEEILSTGSDTPHEHCPSKGAKGSKPSPGTSKSGEHPSK